MGLLWAKIFFMNNGGFHNSLCYFDGAFGASPKPHFISFP